MGQGSTRRSTARPVVKLLADMYKGMKRKGKSPSFIARLMGLDRRHSLGQADRKQKILSERPQASGVPLYVCQSNRSSTMEQRGSKDVYEDLDPAHSMNRRYSSRWSASSMFLNSDSTFTNQKLSDSSWSSPGEKHYVTEEDDTIDLPDSKNVLATSSRKEDSHLSKKLHDNRVNSGGIRSQVAVMKGSNSERYKGSGKAWISESSSSGKLASSNLERRDGLLLDRNYCHRAYSSDFQFVAKNREGMDPSRIVFLEPNLKNMQISGMPGSSCHRSRGCVHNLRGINENSSAGGGPNTLWSKKDPSHSIGISKLVPEEARKLSGRNTSRMRNTCEESSGTNFSLFRGYEGDESSRESLESDSDSEWEVFGLPSRKFYNRSNWGVYPSFGPLDCVNRKIKKRLSERWKTTEKYQDLEIVSKDSTPTEMLSTPEEGTSVVLNAKVSIGKTNSRCGSIRGNVICEGHSRVDDRSGLKDEVHGTSSRSTSLPTAANRRKKEHLSPQADFELNMEAKIKNISERQIMFRVAATNDNWGSTGSCMVVSEHESTTSSFKSFELDPEPPSDIDEVAAAFCDQEDFSFQESPEEDFSSQRLAASECSNQVDYTSPVSVLTAFAENVSFCSNTFGRVNAEFHELRINLQHLKLEPVTPPDVSTLETDIALLSSILSEGKNYAFTPEGWELSYLLDVLIHSGFQQSGSDIFQIMWHSLDSPLDPNLFDDLEKNYDGIDTFGSIPERKLLFDKVNLALLDMFHEQVDMFPWVMPRQRFTWKKEGARDAFKRMIEEECAKRRVAERAIDKETQWTAYRGEIDIMGMEIERVLIEGLMDELFM